MSAPDSTHRLAPASRTLLFVASMVALLWAFIARIAAPSDLWDQTQPKTISYTTDLLIEGGAHWILPIEPGPLPATKPPLYNWVAAPFVALMGFASPIAHKMPSILAACAVWLVLVRHGPRLRLPEGRAVGHVTVVALFSGYTIFKLAYLARPDMLLTLFVMIAWMSGTLILISAMQAGSVHHAAGRAGQQDDSGESNSLPLVFWMSVALAGLTKGPAALLPVAHVLIVAKPLTGSWRSIQRFGWSWGVPLVLIITGGWFLAAWLVNPSHVVKVMLNDEIAGRVTGLGPEGTESGPIEFITTMPNLFGLFIMRTLPWSVFTVLAAVWLFKRREPQGQRQWRLLHPTAGAWLISCAAFVLLNLVVFSLSAGKRADYLAPCYPAASILAAFWLVGRPDIRWPGWPLTACIMAVIAFSGLTMYEFKQTSSPSPTVSRDLQRFVSEAAAIMDSEPLPSAVLWVQDTHINALLAINHPPSMRRVRSLLVAGQPFWVVAGERTMAPSTLEAWLRDEAPHANVQVLARSADLPQPTHWPPRLSLYRVQPRLLNPSPLSRSQNP